MKKVFLLFFVLLLFVVAGCSEESSTESAPSTIDKIQENKKVVIGTAPGYLPFDMKNTEGEFIGYDMDLGRAIAEQLGVEVEFKQFEFSGLIPALQAKEIDLILAGMTITGERAAAVSFSDPYYETGQVIMIPKDDTSTKSWEDLDVEGTKVGVSQGTTGHLLAESLFKKAEVTVFETFPDTALALTQGKVDGVLYDEPAVKMYEAQQADSVKGVYDIISSESLGIAVRSNDLETVQWLNSFLYSYRGSVEDIESKDKWFESKDWIDDIEE